MPCWPLGPDGLDRLQEALDAARHALDFKIERFRNVLADSDSLGARHRSLEKLMDELAALGFGDLPGVRRAPVLERVAELLHVPAADLEQAMPRRRSRAAAQTPDQTPDETPDLWAESADVPPARRRAERELLGALIYQPNLRHQPVNDASEPITKVLEPELFTDPAARRLAEVVWARLRQDRGFTVQQLMGDLDHPSLRDLAGALYLDAETSLSGDELTPLEHLRQRCEAGTVKSRIRLALKRMNLLVEES